MWTKNDGFSVWKHVGVGAYNFRKLYCAVEMWDGGGQGIETCVFVLWNLSGSVNGQESNV